MPKHDSTDRRRNNRGNPQNLVPEFAEIGHALKGIDLPQDKEGLIEQAQENGASDEIISILEGMPDQEYHTMADVMAGAGQTRH